MPQHGPHRAVHRTARLPGVVGRLEPMLAERHSADAAMALLTVHHWNDLEAGIGVLLRIVRQWIVISPGTSTSTTGSGCWTYPRQPRFDDTQAVAVDRLTTLLGGARIETVSLLPTREHRHTLEARRLPPGFSMFGDGRASPRGFSWLG